MSLLNCLAIAHEARRKEVKIRKSEVFFCASERETKRRKHYEEIFGERFK